MRWEVLAATDTHVTLRCCDPDETAVPQTDDSEADDTWASLGPAGWRCW